MSDPSSSSCVSLPYRLSPRALYCGSWKFAYTFAMYLSESLYFSFKCGGGGGGAASMSVPPGDTTSSAVAHTDRSGALLKTTSTGVVPTSFGTSAMGSAARSMTCVTPMDFRYASLCSDAVAMMGEKPESFAS